MSSPALKQLFLNFAIKLSLTLILISSGIYLIITNNDSAKYLDQKEQRLASLITLSKTLEQCRQAYWQIASSNPAKVDSLKSYLSDLSKNKSFLPKYLNDTEQSKSKVKSILNGLEREESFYRKQLDLVVETGVSPSMSANFGEIMVTQGALFPFLKADAEDLQAKDQQNAKLHQNLAYLVIGVGMLILIMNSLIYYKSRKALRKQIVHEKEIYNAKLAAQLANNAKSEYLAMISHEIRTPMNGVLGMSNLLLQGTLSDEQKDYAKTIHHSAESLLRIVNDVLDFSKIEAGKIQLNYAAVDIRNLVEELFDMMPISTDQLQINFIVDDNVPRFVHTDAFRLKQILFNFLSNAKKFTSEGNITLECRVIEKEENGDIRLGFSIKDTGIGIAEERIKLLFKPFVQVDQTSVRRYGGTGLGLNIAYNLISMMSGKVKVSSEVGKGSIFTFFIVTKEVQQTKSVKQTLVPKKENKVLDKALSGAYPLRILAVDDNEINLMLITKTLSKLGYSCQKASNGQLALDLVKQEDFDLIFMDMQMPIMDGTVATTEIRKHYRIYEYPVVIALTANALGDGRDKCLEAGMQDFIAKPFKPAEIEEVIKKWAPKITVHHRKTQSISLS
jgi:signal transduction histidine kinase/ActR/RegA family two-component response regulator